MNIWYKISFSWNLYFDALSMKYFKHEWKYICNIQCPYFMFLQCIYRYNKINDFVFGLSMQFKKKRSPIFVLYLLNIIVTYMYNYMDFHRNFYRIKILNKTLKLLHSGSSYTNDNNHLLFSLYKLKVFQIKNKKLVSFEEFCLPTHETKCERTERHLKHWCAANNSYAFNDS